MMQCRDAQFYMRLRRHVGDELGADVAGDLDHHLAGCPGCAADARAANSFDCAVAKAMGAVAVPAGLRDKLATLASAHRGSVIRRKVYQVAALAASVFVVVGLAFGVFTWTRPRIDTNQLAFNQARLYEDPDGYLRDWLTAQKVPDRLPEAIDFDPYLLISLGSESIQGKDVPVAVFRHPSERGFAKVYVFRDDGRFNLKDLADAEQSFTVVRVIKDPARSRDVQYVVVHTIHTEMLKPFLRQPRDVGTG